MCICNDKLQWYCGDKNEVLWIESGTQDGNKNEE
jgi:hypothetical protein